MPASERPHSSVWTRPSRKERSPLRRELIVEKALELLDVEGVDALSMRKLAGELGVGTTSLYWHVANRDELFELIIDQVYGEVELPAAEGVEDWRAAIRDFSHSVRAVILRHRWVVAVFDQVAAAHLGPNVVEMSGRVLAVFESAGLPLREAEQAMSAVSAYVTGVSIAEAAWLNRLRLRGQTEQEWLDESRAVAEEVAADDPRMNQLMAFYEGDVDVEKMSQEDFEYGLDRVLDGLQLRIDSI